MIAVMAFIFGMIIGTNLPRNTPRQELKHCALDRMEAQHISAKVAMEQCKYENEKEEKDHD